MKQKIDFAPFIDPADPQNVYQIGLKDGKIIIFFDEKQREENGQAEAEDLMQIFLDTEFLDIEGLGGLVGAAYEYEPGFWTADINWEM